MEKSVKETTTTTSADGANTTKTTSGDMKATGPQTIEYLVYFFFGALEILLAFRLILKLTGASPSSGFVSSIYSVTGIFIMPFEGIFHRGFAKGVETASVLEPSTLVAIIVYSVVALGIVKLIRIFSGERQAS